MDVRAFIAGTLSVLALLGLIILQAFGRLDAAVLGVLSGLATGGMTYAVGLYSSPFDAPVAVEVDEPASVVRANDAGWTHVDSMIWVAALALNAVVIACIVRVIA